MDRERRELHNHDRRTTRKQPNGHANSLYLRSDIPDLGEDHHSRGKSSHHDTASIQKCGLELQINANCGNDRAKNRYDNCINFDRYLAHSDLWI